MSTRERVMSFLVGTIRELLGWVVIQAKQDFAIEYDKYILVDLLSEKSLGDFERWDAKNERIYIECLREATFNVQAYGAGAVELLSNLWGELERPLVVDEFYKANISVTSVGDVQDLTELIDNRGWQERASIDLTISYDRTAIDNPAWFEIVCVEGFDQQIKINLKEMKQLGEHRPNCKR